MVHLVTDSLGDLLRQAQTRHNGASGRRLAEIAAAAGHDIDRTTVNRILSPAGYHSRVNRKTIAAVAYLAGVDEAKVFIAAGLPPPRAPFRDEVPDDADLLTSTQRAAVLGVIRSMVEQERELHDLRGEPNDEPSATITAIDDRRARPPAEKRAARRPKDGPDRPIS